MIEPTEDEAIEDEAGKREAIRQEWIEFRHEFCFTQRRLASVLGIGRRTIQEIEAGRTNPHQSTRLKLFELREKHYRNRSRNAN